MASLGFSREGRSVSLSPIPPVQMEEGDGNASQAPLLTVTQTQYGSPHSPIPPEGEGGLPRVRMASVDVLRGLTIALMIFVNNNSGGYPVFLHSAWDGLTFADVVFPTFLFIMGVAMVLSFREKELRSLWKKVIRRTVILFSLGLFLNLYPVFDLASWRVPGVLQRIALCYFVNSAVLLAVPERKSASGPSAIFTRYIYQWMVILALQVVYLILLLGVNVPGCGRGHIGRACNAGQWIDRNLFGPQHMYTRPTCRPTCVPWDPEGVIGTFTAVLSTFLGVHCGRVTLHFVSHRQRVVHWVGAALLLMPLGMLLHFTGWLPFNKNLWSSSFTLFLGGLAGCFLTMAYIIIDVMHWERAVFLLRAVGMNPITLYMGSELLTTILSQIYWDAKWNLYSRYRDTVWASWLADAPASTFFGLSLVTVWLFVGWRMMVHNVIIKI